MSDKDNEHDIPVKVVDRRWWANPDASGTSSDGATTSLKPTYVEELEQKVAEKDKQIQEDLTKYRQASSEFEEMRLRLRREITKDIERTRREILSELLEVVDNLERALDAARRSPSADALLEGVEMVRRQFLSKLEGLGRQADRVRRRPLRPRAPRSHQHRASGVARSGRHGRRRHPSGLSDR